MTLDRSALRKLAERIDAAQASAKRGHPKYIATLTSADELALTTGVKDLLDQFDRAEAECERFKKLYTELLEDYRAEGDGRMEACAQLSACRAALEEACDSWQAHLTGAIKRCGEDGGYRLEQAHLAALRSVGKAK